MPITNDFNHAAFKNDLRPGVAAIARAIHLRQTTNPFSSVPSWSVNPPDFPSPPAANAVLALCETVSPALVDMAPVHDLLSHATTPRHDTSTTTHEQLSILADITHGFNLSPTMEYTAHEKLAVKRLLAAIHLAFCGPLPSQSWSASYRTAPIGCPECITTNATHRHLPKLLAHCLTFGLLDPAYQPSLAHATLRGENRGLKLRLSWKADDTLTATHMMAILKTHGFDTAVSPRDNLVAAQKPMTGNYQDAMLWGSARFSRYSGVTWCGLETIFSPDRGPLD